jgi:ubiquinone/menaquinone biosynthesis C-methylase UbiE
MQINIGAGDVKIPDFLTCDWDENAHPDYCFDLEHDVFPFEDDSVTAVVAHHVLEHLGEGYFHCLKELYRVCKNGAVIDIRVPHHRHDYFADDPTHRRPITVGGLRLFSQKHNRLCREQGAASSRLGEFFKVDFEIVAWDYIPSAEFKNYFDGQSRADVEQYLKQHSNIIEELWVKLIVVK